MPVASSSITIAAIAAEIGGQSAPHTLSTLAGSSVGTFSGGGNNSAPHTMSEWAGYVHTQDFTNTPTYYVRTEVPNYDGSNGVTNRSVQLVSDISDNGSCSSGIGIIFYYILNGSTIEWYMYPDDFTYHNPISADNTDAAFYPYNTSGGSASYTGTYSIEGGSGISAFKIAEFTPDSTTGLQVRMRQTQMSGLLTTIPTTTLAGSYASGYTFTSDWQTPSSTKYAHNPFASSGISFGFDSAVNQVSTYYTTEVKATGYNTKTLRTFVSYWFTASESTGPPL